jgi:uncharacterized protein (DUF1330 family)
MIDAQAKSPVYVVVDIGEVTNPEGHKDNTERSVATLNASLKDFGGRYVARTDQITALDGTASKRIIIIAFDTAQKAKDWYDSPEQKKVHETRIKNTKSRAFIVEGL